jgi:hypothetical protein
MTCRTRLSVIASLCLVALAVAIPVLAASSATRPSPAQGHAEVIAQGAVKLPKEQAAWRVETYPAFLPGAAPMLKRPLSFLLADKDPILVTDGKSGDMTRLAGGEGLLVRSGVEQMRQSLREVETSYYALELVPPDQLDDIGAGTLVLASDAFDAPAGYLDLDLVRDVVAKGETSKIADQETPVLVLVTDGEVEAKTGNSAPIEIMSGEAQLLTGDIAISGKGDGKATFVAAIIGPKIPNAAVKPTTPTPLPTATNAAPVAPTAGEGSVSFLVYNCPPGMTAKTLLPDMCEPAVTTGFEAELSIGLDKWTVSDATVDPSTSALTWSGLQLLSGDGIYIFKETGLLDGFSSSMVQAGGPVSGPIEDGSYDIALNATWPDVLLSVYNFAEGPTGSITIAVKDCPFGMTPATLDPSQCTPPIDSFQLALFHKYVGAMGGVTWGTDRAVEVDTGVFTWIALPYSGDHTVYQIVEATLPPGYTSAVVEGLIGDAASGDPFGWPGVEISATNPDATVTLYNFQP